MYKLTVYMLFMIVGSDAAKILGVFPIPSISHQIVFRRLMLELANRGHEVTVITPDPAFSKGQSQPNFTEIDVHDISYELWNTLLNANRKNSDRLKFFKIVVSVMTKIFHTQLMSNEVQKLLKDEKEFDLLFIESIIQPALIFSHIYNIPVIEISSVSDIFGIFDRIGGASHPLIYPSPLHRRIYNMTLWDKVNELYIHYASQWLYFKEIDAANLMLKSVFGSKIPEINDLMKNVQMLFLSVHSIWDFNRPVPPNVLYLGGLHQTPKRELSKDWKSYLDNSKNGVIYMSFGTNVKLSMLPPETLKIFINVFAQLSYDVILKYDGEELSGISKNVKISKWVPQSDLLRHPKVKLFITQGGLQSTDEAITAGVPVVGVPLFGDQWFNVEQYVKFNIGKRLMIETLTEKELRNAIITVIEDKSYRHNIVKLRTIIDDQPQTPLERAVWWTEYVLRHGGAKHLRTATALMSWTKYYELELVLSILFILIISLAVLVLAVYYIVSKIMYRTHSKIKKN